MSKGIEQLTSMLHADVIALLAERDADKALIAEQQRKLIHREFLLETADQVQKEYAEALGCAGDNESILEAIDGWQEQARTIDMSNGVLNSRIADTDDALCKLLPGCQYMDPPDGGSVTPLEQVSRMVADYRQQIAEQAKSIDFLKKQLAQLANFNPDWDKLEAATDSLREQMAELTEANKRIAELEARTVTVKLPPVSFFDFKLSSRFASGAYVNVEAMNKGLAAAGITLVVGE